MLAIALNPWGLTGGQAAALDALIAEGTLAKAATKLGVKRDTIATHLAQVRRRMGTEVGDHLKYVLEWDRWRHGAGKGVVMEAPQPAAARQTSGDMVAAAVVEAGQAGLSVRELNAHFGRAVDVHSGLAQGLARQLIHRGGKCRHYRYFAQREWAREAPTIEPPAVWMPVVELVRDAGPAGLYRAELIQRAPQLSLAKVQNWLKRAVEKGHVFRTGKDKHYLYFATEQWAREAAPRLVVDAPRKRAKAVRLHHMQAATSGPTAPPISAAQLAKRDVHGPAGSGQAVTLHPNFKHTVLPSMPDTRFAAGPGFRGGDSMAEWRRRRGEG